MLPRALLTLAVAAPLAVLDLAYKSATTTPDWAYHVRSGGWILLAGSLVLACVGLAWVPSGAVAAAAGVLAGGTTGNLVSALASERGIPNPIVVGSRTAIAFNLADVFTLLGIAVLMGTLVALTIRNRARLQRPGLTQ